MGKFIVTSKEDPASLNVFSILVENIGFKETDNRFEGEPIYSKDDVSLVLISKPLLTADYIGEKLNAELIVVASRHSSKEGVKSLLVHPVGNWGTNELGGLPDNLSMTSCVMMYSALMSLKEEASSLSLDDWRIGMEATHHGPFTLKPMVFVELGGKESDWNDRKGAEAVAVACLSAFKRKGGKDHAVAFGGSHYAPKFTDKALNQAFQFGHIAPKYAFPLPESMISQAFNRTLENPDVALVDWKGIPSSSRSSLITILEKLGKEYVRC